MQALQKARARFVIQELLSQANVGSAFAHVSRAGRFEDRFDIGLENLIDSRDEVQQTIRRATGDVDRLADGRCRIRCQQVSLNHVVDVRKIARLPCRHRRWWDGGRLTSA